MAKKVVEIASHVELLPEESRAPLRHLRRSSTDLWNLLEYFERKTREGTFYDAVRRRHLAHLHRMLFVNLIETFERFLKESAAICIDEVAWVVLDDRFKDFKITGTAIAVHFRTDTVGKSLCEASTWLDCGEVTDRFRKVLADPFVPGTFYLFPNKGQSPVAERGRFETMNILWQLRNSVVHNVGVLTQSDAAKLRLLTKSHVDSPRVLSPTRDDLSYVKRFLDETAESCNRRVGVRLAELLTTLHADAAQLVDAPESADRISKSFGMTLTVGGNAGNPSG